MVKETKNTTVYGEILHKKQEKILKLKGDLNKEKNTNADLREQIEKLKKKLKRTYKDQFEIGLQKTYLRGHVSYKYLHCTCQKCPACRFYIAEKQMTLPPKERDESLLLRYSFRGMFEEMFGNKK